MDESETLWDINVLAENAGVSISKHQLERWRFKGLLPRVQQIGKGRGAGSEVRYPVGTAQQAVAIVQLLAVKDKFDFVGWNLWLQGYLVEDRYWRPILINAARLIRRTTAYVRLMEMKTQHDNSTIYEKFEVKNFANSPIYKALSSLKPDARAYVLTTFADIALGRFSGFSSYDEIDFKIQRDNILSAIGINNNVLTKAISRNMGFYELIEPRLKDISISMRSISSNAKFLSAIEIENGRQITNQAIKFVNVFNIFNEIVLHGSARFLKMGAQIVRRSDFQAAAILVLGKVYASGSIKSGTEIAEMISEIELPIALMVEEARGD